MPCSLLEARDQPVDDAAIEVLAAEEGVAGGRDDLEHAVADLEDRDVERAAAEIVDRDPTLEVLAEAVGQGRRGGLVDDADDVEAGDRPASLVAWRWPSLKYAGTVTTALPTSSPRYSSAMSFISCRIIALISGTENTLIAQHGSRHVAVGPLDDAVRHGLERVRTCGPSPTCDR
jgi:hypothetical protein